MILVKITMRCDFMESQNGRIAILAVLNNLILSFTLDSRFALSNFQGKNNFSIIMNGIF